ncbi:PilW family protein [Solilutibacter tolerans]|nr:PilW family protein [Lysobacter tolerans]
MRGFSLIELMIALLLGLIVIGSAGSIYLANKRAYAATEVLGRVQESSRIAFELMARDIREAAAVPCAKDIPIANVLGRTRSGTAPPPTDWKYNFGDGVLGYEPGDAMSDVAASGTGSRYPGTDAIELHSGADSGITVETHHAPSAQFKVNKAGFIQDGDILMVCDFNQASIFQVTNANNSNVTIVHNAGNSETPGNCTKALGYPVDCSAQCTGSGGGSGPSNNKSCKEYGRNSMIVRFRGVRWYVGRNAQGGGSLYRMNLANSLTGSTVMPEEVTDGVDNMQLSYLLDGADDYVPAAAGMDWKKVKAVKVIVTLSRLDSLATGTNAVARQLNYTVTIRNRVD